MVLRCFRGGYSVLIFGASVSSGGMTLFQHIDFLQLKPRAYS